MSTPSEIFYDSVLSILSNVHTALPGIIKKYDPATNKATIQPALNKLFTDGEMPMPLLENVPIMFGGGKNFNVTFPINPGDYVLLIFMERSIDLWKSVGGQVTPDDPRKFALSDAVAIPGLMPFTGTFAQNSGTDLVINYAGSEIRIKENGDIQIKTASKVAIGNTTTEVLQVLSDLMGYLMGPAVTGNSLGGPLQPTFTAFVATLKTQLDLIKGNIT